MRKFAVLTVACIALLAFVMPTHAGGSGWGKICKQACDPCIIKNKALPTGEWRETLQGGLHGVPGNALHGEGGKVWVLDALLSEVVTGFPCEPDPEFPQVCYLTRYGDGTESNAFTLNLPCCEKALVDPDVKAINYSSVLDDDPDGRLVTFKIQFSGQFEVDGEDAGIFYEATANYTGQPEMTNDGDDVIQGDKLDDVTLVLWGDLNDVCKKKKENKEKPGNVFVCHVESVETIENPFSFFTNDTTTVGTGRIIQVSANALDAHLANGDCEAPDGEKGADCVCESNPAVAD